MPWLIAGALLVPVAFAVGPALEPAPAAAPAAHDHGGAVGSEHHRDHASADASHAPPADLAPEAPLRDAAGGRVPAEADAPSLPTQLQSFRAVGDDGLAELAKEGWLAGQGTPDDPWVIEGFRVRGDLEVRDTSAPLIIRDSLVQGQLKLNYNGAWLHVHHNRIHDLRVNENVERRAETTAGLFDHNAIAVVGQLRHFGGEFAFNDVGPAPSFVAEVLGDAGPQPFEPGRVWNFDGYHLAWAHDNVVQGRVDIKLHGHYHGSCATCPSHQHDEDHADVDHTDRWHSLRFEDNDITVQAGPALRVNDRAHAGDDRTANSEPDPHLELAHEHHTLLMIARNALHGGPLVFDVVDAEDERHEGIQQAMVALDGNEVDQALPRGFLANERIAAYEVRLAQGLAFAARDNAYRFTDGASPLPSLLRDVAEPRAATAGFLFDEAAGLATIATTQGDGARWGVLLQRAGQLDLDLDDNAFHAQEEIHDG
ncbi:MAG TPA: hypothetical protein VGR28_15290 [Candidatus Thermoplasmatota archaeon]|nr:hypothetical protein [Candidatus Thermoplasmatota archaeon]